MVLSGEDKCRGKTKFNCINGNRNTTTINNNFVIKSDEVKTSEGDSDEDEDYAVNNYVDYGDDVSFTIVLSLSANGSVATPSYTLEVSDCGL